MSDVVAQWVVVGRVGAPFGLEGWVHIQSFTDDLLGYPQWWIEQRGYQVPMTIQSTRTQGSGIVAKWLGSDSREQAMVYRGAAIVVPRSALPSLDNDPDAFYWVDLEGCSVFEQQDGVYLGRVEYLYEGAQDIMVVQPDAAKQQIHIPFSMHDVVQKVDLTEKKIWVDWPFGVM